MLKNGLAILLLCSAINLFGSDQPISGIILDAETKEPLPFANIVVDGKNKGTTSDGEGHFVIDLTGVQSFDTIWFSYTGYTILKITALELKNTPVIYLHQTSIKLKEIKLISKTLTAEEIIKLVYKNYKQNYLTTSNKQLMFIHKQEMIPFQKKNQLLLKKTNFVGIDSNTFNKLFKKLPLDFIDYQDAIVELYSDREKHKLVPLKGITLEVKSQQALVKEFENKLGAFFDDIDKSNADPDVYYKFRSGIFSYKIKNKGNTESGWSEYKKDTNNQTVQTNLVKSELLTLINDYTNIESENLEFINKSRRYDYVLKEVTILNDEQVYKISFTPHKRGLFEGIMYISTATYAILELNFAFEKGKETEQFQMLGFGHSMNFKEGRVVFEKRGATYAVKYICAQQNESVLIDRDLSIMKKKKRFLIDKELNEIKLKTQLSFDTQIFWKLLVLNREEIDAQQFLNAKQPQTMKFKKEYVNKIDFTSNTSIVPVMELKKYKK